MSFIAAVSTVGCAAVDFVHVHPSYALRRPSRIDVRLAENRTNQPLDEVDLGPDDTPTGVGSSSDVPLVLFRGLRDVVTEKGYEPSLALSVGTGIDYRRPLGGEPKAFDAVLYPEIEEWMESDTTVRLRIRLELWSVPAGELLFRVSRSFELERDVTSSADGLEAQLRDAARELLGDLPAVQA